MEMPLISIVVPVYKVEAYLDRCVQSIVDQTYRNLEIILVDDGSPDNCGSLCDAWAAKDSRIKVIHKENGGSAQARNVGLDCASGEYIGFVDSDDILHGDCYELLYQEMKRHGAEIAACDYLLFCHELPFEQTIIDTNASVHTAEGALEALASGRTFRAVVWNKIYRRSLWKDINFPAGRKIDDEFVTYRVLDKAKRLVYLDVPLYYYRQHESSVMATIGENRLDALDAYLERLELFNRKYPKLYKEGKVKFCNACVNAFCDALYAEPNSFKKQARRIKKCRKQVKITFTEFWALPLARKAYVLGGRFPFPFCTMLNWIRKRRNG